MAIDDLFGSVKRKVGAGVLGLGLVLGSAYGGMGCGEEKEYTCEDACDHLESCNALRTDFPKESCINECKTYDLDGSCPKWFDCVYGYCSPTILDNCEDFLCIAGNH